MAHTPQQCTAKTRSGRQCRSWAIHGQSLCSVHAHRNAGGGGQAGNQNARKHGYYGRFFSVEELASLGEGGEEDLLTAEITAAKVQVGRLLKYLEDMPSDVDPFALAKLNSAAFDGLKTVGALSRVKYSMEGAAGDGISGAIAQILNEVGAELGAEL